MKALIIGINGQDGSFMAELLIKKDYEVYGMIRRSSINNLERLKNIKDNKKLKLLYGDLTDSLSILNIIKNVQPDEIYNFGAQSDVKVSFDVPEYTADVDGIGVLRILEAVHILHLEKNVKYINHQHQNYMEILKNRCKMKKHHLYQILHMLLQNYMHIIYVKYIKKHMVCIL